jgi:hypothetical protein
MSETSSQARIEPIIDPGPSAPPQNGVAETRNIPPAPMPAVPDRPSSVVELLARLEDKTARIEEKLSRSEAFTARVIDRFEASSQRMNEVAQQAELMAVRSETKFIARSIRKLPGFGAVVLSSVVTAVLTAILTILIIRFLPNLIGR